MFILWHMRIGVYYSDLNEASVFMAAANPLFLKHNPNI